MMTKIGNYREALQYVDAQSEKVQDTTSPKITFNLSGMSGVELYNLIISAAIAAAPKWHEAGVKLNTYPLPLVEIVAGVTSAPFLNLPAGDPVESERGKSHRSAARRVACSVNIELPDLVQINQTLEDYDRKEVYKRGFALMRAWFKKGGGNEVV
ncbi:MULTISPECIES: hypothetical protein [Aeromonas]|uniref:Uncharacterized protein n=1 Tax=Aeromonas veronii TaxID=654 RepID=A0A4S5C7D1_AERVE|nr:hypothetical protein [Aeromonas veronii]MBL0445992.1 hypothetical protein [Aeromonas veronii]THJ41514.1 hypothetical protein E8Q35_17745 [Aeromonas veronii]